MCMTEDRKTRIDAKLVKYWPCGLQERKVKIILCKDNWPNGQRHEKDLNSIRPNVARTQPTLACDKKVYISLCIVNSLCDHRVQNEPKFRK